MEKKRGFSTFDPAVLSEISSRGGKEAHRRGTAHKFTSEEAVIAGRKGGEARAARKREEAAREVPVVISTDPGCVSPSE